MLASVSLTTILIFALAFLFFAALPIWPHSSRWGFGPSGALAAILLIVFMLMMAGQLPHTAI
jgi:hypothetical protein